MAEINSPEVTEQSTEFISYFIISKAGGLEIKKKKKQLIKDLFIQSFQMIFYRTESLYGKRERERDLVTIKWHLLNFYWF